MDAKLRLTNQVQPTRRGSAVHRAVARKSYEELEALLDHYRDDIHGVDRHERTPLHWAVLKNFEKGVTLLLEGGANIDAADDRKETPLHYATFSRNEKLMKILLEKGADVNREKSNGRTPLHIAIKQNAESVVELLLEHGASVDVTDSKWNTPLHLACKIGNIVVVDRLLVKKANIYIKNHYGNTPLHLASKMKRTDLIEIFMSNSKSNLDCLKKYSLIALSIFSKNDKVVENMILKKEVDMGEMCSDGNTLLQLAIRCHNYEAFELLLSGGVDINGVDQEKNTPLHIASKIGNIKAVEKLLKHGSLVNVKRNHGEFTPLHEAVHEHHYTIAKLLLDNGADVNLQDTHGGTPLHIAAEKGDLLIVNLLLDQMADVKVTDKLGCTPLHFAAKSNSRKIVNLLLDCGADINASDNDGRRPIHFSSLQCQMTLLNRGSDVNVKDNSGQTPLHIAVIHLCKDVSKSLLKNGANNNIKDDEGNAPVHFASQIRLMDILWILLETGGYTPLHVAILSRRDDEVDQLLEEKSVDIEAKDVNLETPLQLAMRCFNDEAFAKLILYGADVTVDVKGTSPLHYVIITGYYNDFYFRDSYDVLLGIILARCVDINKKNTLGMTALHLASDYDWKTLRLLLEFGAEVNVQDHAGQTPLHYVTHWDDSLDPQTKLDLLAWGASMTAKNNEGKSPLDAAIELGESYVEPFKKHVLKIEALNLRSSVDYDFHYNEDDEAFLKRCQEDVNVLKNKKFAQYSLFDVFGCYHDPTYVNNKEMEAAVMSEEGTSNYQTLLRATFLKAKKRSVLLDKAQNLLNITLPVEVVRIILSYLNDEDLKNVLKLELEHL